MSVKFGSAVVCWAALGICLQAFFTTSSQAQSTIDSPAVADADRAFQLQGEYAADGRGVQVVALGEDEFAVILLEGGLPGAGWDRSPPRRQELDGEQVLEFLTRGGFAKTIRQSPTLGAVPPERAVVLFDGTSAALKEFWEPGARITEDGLLMEGATSRLEFENYTLHLEFRTPFMPQARGQARGNSGVYHQGRFETQILDSFGLEGRMDETGGIYTIKAPDLNMCLPPLSWQTYDVDFTAARFDAEGKLLSLPRMTVRLNGVIVQQDVELPHATRAALFNDIAPAGPIYLQDHGNPVRFRNIWVKPRDLASEARRPRLPAFDRLFADASDDPLGGQLLVSELGCTNCHAGPTGLESVRQAPVLDEVGKRLQPDFLVNYLQDPHRLKSGTTMPDVLAHLDAPGKELAARAIASFLIASTGNSQARPGDPRAVTRGEALFHSIGCTACHASQRTAGLEATSVPLGDLDAKYVLDGLAEFLEKPHAIRPSARMPSFGLTREQAFEVATYLLRDSVVGHGTLSVRAEFFIGSWDALPDFDSLASYLETDCFDFDVTASGRPDDFAARFTTWFIAPSAGNYRFSIGSDDGSRIFIDDQLVADNDGVHAMQHRSGEIQLSAGAHRVRVEYFEKGGEEMLQVDVEGPNLPRTNLGLLATLDPQALQNEKPVDKPEFEVDDTLVAMGESLYQSTGCAACHQLSIDGQVLESTRPANELVNTNSQRGCMAGEVTGTAPRYDLSPAQRSSIAAFMGAGKVATQETTRLHLRMASLNCYACHARGSVGGAELARDAEFRTTMKEMGDEGRLPPPLNGVGDKLRREYIESIVTAGVNERPYMLVNMPGFGAAHASEITRLLVSLDEKHTSLPPVPDVSEEKLKSDGRLLVGDKGLSCVKCHTFGGLGAPGIQAIDLQRMTNRLREDWFHRYLLAPATYRPGTRMPASFPDGKSVLPELFNGEPGQQVRAMWSYLVDGASAREPIGVAQEMIELLPTDRPILYRNFIQGLTPRGIGVGYPEKVHLAWDANRMSLTLLWKGAFIDASRHWVGRGPGNQGPLGDEILTFERAAPLARLENPAAIWPSAEKGQGKFLGYRLDEHRAPTFRYRMHDVTAEDRPQPIVKAGNAIGMGRELKLTGKLHGIYFRAAAGKTIEPQADGWYRIDGRYSVRVSGEPAIRQAGNQSELILAVDGDKDSMTIEQAIVW
jgi:mono/diheme cytochrome c family protein